MVEKIKQAKANTMMRVNNVIWAKISDSENSKWRSAFGEMYANSFINMVKQAKTAEFLDKTPLKSVKKNEERADNRHRSLVEKYHVPEEESEYNTN